MTPQLYLCSGAPFPQPMFPFHIVSLSEISFLQSLGFEDNWMTRRPINRSFPRLPIGSTGTTGYSRKKRQMKQVGNSRTGMEWDWDPARTFQSALLISWVGNDNDPGPNAFLVTLTGCIDRRVSTSGYVPAAVRYPHARAGAGLPTHVSGTHILLSGVL